MAARWIPIVLLGWIAIGVVVWLAGGDEPPPVDAFAPPGSDPAAAGEAEPGQAERAPPVAPPVLERPARAEDERAALLERLRQGDDPGARAALTAYLRAHPEEAGAVVGAVARQRPRSNQEQRVLWQEVLGPLHDLEPALSRSLLAALAARSGTDAAPQVVALAALLPLGAATRQALEAELRRAGPTSGQTPLAVLLVRSAASGEELRDFVRWLLAPAEGVGGGPRHRISTWMLMREIAALGPRARPLVPDLLAAVDPRGLRVSRATLDALVKIGADDVAVQQAVAGWLASHGSAREVAVAYFAAREDGQQQLLAALGHEAPQVRLGAVLLLHEKGWASRDALLPPLLTCLTCADALWRERAMRMIPFMAPRVEDVVPTLDAMFRSTDEAQWVTAAKTLQLLSSVPGDQFDVTLVLEGALRHTNVGVRRQIAQGLMHYPARTAVPLLEEALRDEDAGVREKAADALGELAQENAAALATLKNATTHEDPQVVAMATAWLEEIEAAAKQAALEEDGGR